MNARRLTAAILALVGGALAAVSALFPWWSINESGSAVATVSFLPGNSFHAQGNGASLGATYSSFGLGPLATLFNGVLGMAIGIAVASILLGVFVLLAAFGKLRNPARYGLFRNLLIVTVAVALLAVVLVPALQPYILTHNTSSIDFCTLSTTSQNPCNAFWGSGNNGAGSNYSWGADVGWYLMISGAALLVAAVALWMSSRSAPWGAASPTGLPVGLAPVAAASSASPLSQIVQLKSLADAGVITAAEFETTKTRLLARATGEGEAYGPPLPDADLRQLKTLHDSGVLNEVEYSDAKRKILDRV